MTMTHAELVVRAERWLKQRGCGVVIRDPFQSWTESGEQPDAIGWRDGISILVECKVSRADFLADKTKHFRLDPTKGMGDWRFYLTPPGVASPEDLPAGWGLIYALPRQIKQVQGVPSNCGWWNDRPFEGAKRSENKMLVSALRRMVIRGHFDLIYQTLDELSGPVAQAVAADPAAA